MLKQKSSRFGVQGAEFRVQGRGQVFLSWIAIMKIVRSGRTCTVQLLAARTGREQVPSQPQGCVPPNSENQCPPITKNAQTYLATLAGLY